MFNEPSYGKSDIDGVKRNSGRFENLGPIDSGGDKWAVVWIIACVLVAGVVIFCIKWRR